MAIDPKKQLPGGPQTVNEAFFDAMVRHQIGLLRLTGDIRNKITKLLNASEQDIADKIRGRLASHRGGVDTPADITRMQTLLKAVRARRLDSWRQIDEVWISELRELAKSEPGFVNGALKTVVPVTLETVLPSVSLLSAMVTTRPFEGRVLRSWARDIRAADIRRIEDQIKIGMVQGEGSDAIARRVVGTARLKGRDGITELSRRQAAAVTRTAVIAISNMAKREFYKANESILGQELYVATLDSKTTPICRSLDGERFPIGEGPMPPLHFNCRSLRVAIIDGEAIGSRPARPFTERQMLREFSEQSGSPVVSSRASLPRGFKGAFDTFKASRIRELTGRVPAKVSYGEWLGRQSVSFQNDVLGRSRAALFRKGKLTLDKFVNRSGDEIPLRDLARSERQAFIDAGLDPEDFM